MIDYYETKAHPITKKMLLDAYKTIRNNGKAFGVDQISLDEFALNVSENLYRIWNRMTSGSYFPLPVREVEIPKKSGGKRKLGIPTVSDRIAQQVVKNYLQPLVENSFHENSYGYRVGMNAYQAVDKAYFRCRYHPWVIDLDIKGFFDNIDHDLLLKAIKRYTSEKWILLYVSRWLKAGIMKGDLLEERVKGTPQGGVISPLLSNIFLHFVFDMWIKKNYPDIRFERYCDDIIVHCYSEKQALFIKDAITKRLKQCGLELNLEKTKLVYCRNDSHREKHKNGSFDFLGFTFRPLLAKTKNGIALIFAPRMSNAAKMSVRLQIKSLPFFFSEITIEDLAKKINLRTRGWIYYYCKFGQRSTSQLWHWLNLKLVRWLMKRRRLSKKKACKWLRAVYEKQPALFEHWKLVSPISTK